MCTTQIIKDVMLVKKSESAILERVVMRNVRTHFAYLGKIVQKFLKPPEVKPDFQRMLSKRRCSDINYRYDRRVHSRFFLDNFLKNDGFEHDAV